MAEKPDASKDPVPAETTDAGVKQVRETAKWLVAGFGALGAALIASLQLRDIGGLSGADQALALAGFGIGIFGVLVALVATGSVLAAQRVELREVVDSDGKLRDYVESNPELLLGYASLDRLYSDYTKASRDRANGYLARLDATTTEDAEAAQGQYEKAKLRLDLVNPIVDQILTATLFEKVRDRWVRVALPLVVIGVVLTTIGTGLFTSQLKDKNDASELAVVPTPVRAVMDLSKDGEDQFAEALGEGCDLSAVAVVVLSSSDNQWKLVTTDDDCSTRHLEVSEDEASIVSCELATASGTEISRQQPPKGNAVGTVALISTQEQTTTTAPAATVPLPESPSGGPCSPIKVK